MTIEGTIHLPGRVEAPAPAAPAKYPDGAMDFGDAPAPTAPAPGDAGAPPDPAGTSDAAQIKELAQAMVDNGHWTEAQRDAALKAEGIESTVAKPEPGLSPEAAEIDAAFPVPPPHAYTMPRLIEDGEEYTPDVAAWDKGVRQLMSDARLPVAIGSAIAQEVARFEKTWVAMSPGEQELHVRSEQAALQRLWNHEYESKLGLVRQLAAEIHAKHPEVFEHLVDKGLFSNAVVVGQIAEHASRLAARKTT